MSLDAMLWALNCPRVSNTSDLAVLIVLAECANSKEDHWLAWPSQERIAEFARMSTRTVRTCLGRLREAGVVVPGPVRVVMHIPADRRPLVWRLLPVPGEMSQGPEALSTRWREEQERRGEARYAKRVERLAGGSEGHDFATGHSFRDGGTPVPINHPQGTTHFEPVGIDGHLATSTPAGGEGPAEPDLGRSVAEAWWKEQHPPPIGKGAKPSLVNVCRAAVAAGHSPEAIQIALDGIGTVPSLAQLDRRLKGLQRAAPVSRRAQALMDAESLIQRLGAVPAHTAPINRTELTT